MNRWFAKDVLKGQSAMEYLMTYGWAILAVVIVIALLAFIVPLYAPERCTFSDMEFSCSGQRLYSQWDGLQNIVYADIQYNGQKQIQILGMACSSTGIEPKLDSNGLFEHPLFRVPNTSTDKKLILSSQSSFNTGIVPSNRFRIQCVDIDSNGELTSLSADVNGNMRPAPFDPGQKFSGKIFVAYKQADEPLGLPPKIAIATLSSQVQ